MVAPTAVTTWFMMSHIWKSDSSLPFGFPVFIMYMLDFLRQRLPYDPPVSLVDPTAQTLVALYPDIGIQHAARVHRSRCPHDPAYSHVPSSKESSLNSLLLQSKAPKCSSSSP